MNNDNNRNDDNNECPIIYLLMIMIFNKNKITTENLI